MFHDDHRHPPDNHRMFSLVRAHVRVRHGRPEYVNAYWRRLRGPSRRHRAAPRLIAVSVAVFLF